MVPTSSMRAAAAALGVALLLGGCATAAAEPGPGPGGSATAGRFGPDGPGPSDRPDPALSGEPVPTLPSGDPGTGSGAPADDGAGTDDDEAGGGHDDDDDAPVASVPESALVDAGTVGALAGGSWSVGPAEPDACVTGGPGSTASRSLSLTGPEGRLVQTVAAHPGVPAARAAVPATADRLVACGFTRAGDPRLGDASAELARPTAAGGEEKAVVIAADGITVVVVATGSAAAAGVWESLADVALGTSCAASAHGCH